MEVGDLHDSFDQFVGDLGSSEEAAGCGIAPEHRFVFGVLPVAYFFALGQPECIIMRHELLLFRIKSTPSVLERFCERGCSCFGFLFRRVKPTNEARTVDDRFEGLEFGFCFALHLLKALNVLLGFGAHFGLNFIEVGTQWTYLFVQNLCKQVGDAGIFRR